MSIRYLRNKDIDKVKWDELIKNSPQGQIYSYSWYLDAMAENWDALIKEDYKAVFPLPWNRKSMGFKRVYQPRVCQQLGLFTLEEEIDKNELKEFLELIPAHFKFIDILLNESNPAPELDNWKVINRTNMLINLNKEFKDINNNYNRSVLRNLKKGKEFGLKITQDIRAESLFDIYLNENKTKIVPFTKSDKRKVQALLNNAKANDSLLTSIVRDRDENIHAIKILFKSSKRIYSTLGVSTDLGRNSGAMHTLIDDVLNNYSGTNYIFDFEGSSIPGIASFFEGFGAEKKIFYRIINNRLPKWFNLIRNMLITLFKS